MHRLLLIILLCSCSATAVAQDTQTTDVDTLYQELFGEEERAALSSSTFTDDITLAARILDACRALEEQQALRIHMCERAFTLAQRRDEGLTVAVAAMQLLSQVSLDHAASARSRILDVYMQAFRRSRGRAKQEHANKLIRYATQYGDLHFARGEHQVAVSMYQRGAGVARSIRSDKRKSLVRRTDIATNMLTSQTRIQRLAAQLATAENPRLINTQLATACLVDAADFDAAAWYAQSADDAELARMVHLVNQRPRDLEPTDLLSAGTWLMTMANRAADYPKSLLLRRAVQMFTAYLQNDQQDEVQRLLADTRRATCRKMIKQLDVPRIRRQLTH